MTFDPESWLVLEAVIAGEGWAEADAFFIREPDDR